MIKLLITLSEPASNLRFLTVNCVCRKEAHFVMDQSILLKIYRGEYAPYRRKDQNFSSYDKLMALQEEILAALPEEKRPLMDSVQDAINTLLMDEGESAFIEGVTFGARLMMEVGGGD